MCRDTLGDGDDDGDGPLVFERESTFVPWRDSKLTRLLQVRECPCVLASVSLNDASHHWTCVCLQPLLSGHSSVSVVVTLSPSDESISESLSTLLFAERAMAIEVVTVRTCVGGCSANSTP